MNYNFSERLERIRSVIHNFASKRENSRIINKKLKELKRSYPKLEFTLGDEPDEGSSTSSHFTLRINWIDNNRSHMIATLVSSSTTTNYVDNWIPVTYDTHDDFHLSNGSITSIINTLSNKYKTR